MGINTENFLAGENEKVEPSYVDAVLEVHNQDEEAHPDIKKTIADTQAFYEKAQKAVSEASKKARESEFNAKDYADKAGKYRVDADTAAQRAENAADIASESDESAKKYSETAKQSAKLASGYLADTAQLAEKYLSDVADAVEVAKSVHPKIIDGVWWVYDTNKGEMVSTRISAQGLQGAKGDKGDKGDVPLVRLRYESDTGNLYYSSDEVLDEDYNPGQKIADGGEIFNDYDKNIALGKYSKASGHQTSILDKVEISEQEIKYISYADNVLTLSSADEFFDTADLWGFRIENTNTKIQSDVLKVLSSAKNSDGSWSFEVEAPIEALNLGTPNSISILAILNGEETGEYACAEGWGNLVIGRASHVENWNNKSFANYQHIEGTHNIGRASGVHIEGGNNEGCGSFTHLEGCNNVSEEGSNYSHIEGIGNISKAGNTHLEGYHIISKHKNAHYQGKFNDIEDETEYAHVVGGGTSENDRKNIHTLDWSGNAMFAGNIIFNYNGKTYNLGQALENLENLNLVDGNEVAY